MKRVYVWRDGRIQELTGKEPGSVAPLSPAVIGDIKPYKSMITGETIGSRSTHRAHLRAHGYTEVGNEIETLMRPRVPTETRELREDILRAIHHG